MKNFCKKVIASFYSSEFYQEAKEQRTNEGIKFVFHTTLCLGLILGIIGLILSVAFFPKLKNLAINYIERSYPQELVINIKDGLLTSNNDEPVPIPLPTGKIENAEREEKLPKNLIVLAQNEKAEISLLDKYDTIALLTSNGILYRENSNEGFIKNSAKTYGYGKLEKEFTKNSVLSDSDNILNKGKNAFMIGIIPMVIFFYLMIALGNMLLLFLITIFTYLMFRLRKIKLSYRKCYRLGLRALVPLLILQTLAFFLGLAFFGIWIPTLIVLIVIFIATSKWSAEINIPAEIENTEIPAEPEN